MAGLKCVAVFLGLLVIVAQLPESGADAAENVPHHINCDSIPKSTKKVKLHICVESNQTWDCRQPTEPTSPACSCNPEQEPGQVSVCPAKTDPISCPKDYRYRSIDGRCNNRRNPEMGQAGSPYKRMFPPEYEDRAFVPRGWDTEELYNGHKLPEPRLVSNIMGDLKGDERLDTEHSQLLVYFGQLATHDIMLSVAGQAPCNGSSCNNEGNNFPIQVPPNDSTRNTTQSKCIPFTRSEPACCKGAKLRNQINGVTPAVDASFLYGTKDCEMKTLRNTTSQRGLLKVNEKTDNGRPLMPFANITKDQCGPGAGCPTSTQCANNVSCFTAGDSRANQHIGLMGLQTFFLRIHNNVATQLHTVNPHWNDELLYQETRKIVIATMQRLVFDEYLPVIFGDAHKELIPPYSGYKKTVDHSMRNEVTIGFRWAHAAVASYVYLLNHHFQPDGPNSVLRFHETFFSPGIPLTYGFDSIFRGILIKSAKLMTPDKVMIEDIRNKLFALKGTGGDLFATDINRERDHGIQGYLTLRKSCCLSQPRNQKELTEVFKNETVSQELMKLYGTPKNIDFGVGALFEPFVQGGRVGPLQACIFARQFRDTRDGDRFFWENEGVFTEKQRAELRKMTFPWLFCDNTGLDKVPLEVFKANKYPKDFVNCKTLAKPDMTAWKENPNSPVNDGTQYGPL